MKGSPETIAVVMKGVAKSRRQLKKLGQDKKKTTKRPISRRFGKVAGLFAGYSAATRVTRTFSGPVDPWAATLRPVEAAVSKFIDDAIGSSATAKRQTREATREAFKHQVGEGPGMEAAMADYKTMLPLNEEVQSGRNIVRTHPSFKGPSFTDLLKSAIPGYFALVGRSVKYIIDEIKK